MLLLSGDIGRKNPSAVLVSWRKKRPMSEVPGREKCPMMFVSVGNNALESVVRNVG